MSNASLCSLNCTCLGTLSPDLDAQRSAGQAPFAQVANELCGNELGILGEAIATAQEAGQSLSVGCRRKEAFFRDVLGQSGFEFAPGEEPRFVDVHASALWSDEAPFAGPKLAALHAKAQVELPDVATVTYESAGVTLILGRDDAALELARALQGQLDVTVLLLPGAEALPRTGDLFPVAQGRVREASGYLGAFKLVVDSYALAPPAPRGGYGFGMARDGAVSSCDLVIDLTGGTPLFSAAELRPGYLRADPARPGVVSDLIVKASGMSGSFDKLRFVELAPSICAHSRNRIEGCRNCIDLCPTGAITSGGDAVSIDPMICAGCGQCAAACPSGAITYAVPPAAAVAEQLRAMLMAYADAGATRRPVLLFADMAHGVPQIEMLARLGDGLPAHVIPVEVNEITRLGLDLLSASLAWGADLVLLVPERPAHPLDGLETTLTLLRELTAPMGIAPEAIQLIACDDPERLGTALRATPAALPRAFSRLMPPSDKRGLMIAALTELNRLAPAPQTTIALTKGAPFGSVTVNPEACTLCMACAGACPAGALVDNPETPMLRFTESACLQCGICASTCPEQAITLTPQADFTAWDQPRRILHEEEPFCCTGCGKGFGTRSGIERVMQKLSGHWMFTGTRGNTGLSMLTLCEDCRVVKAAEAGFEPHH